MQAELYNERPALSTKSADTFTTRERATLAEALADRAVPSNEDLLGKLVRHYVLTRMITVARSKVTIAGESLFKIGSGRFEWPAGNTPTHILQAAINNIANTHLTYDEIRPYIDKWAPTFHDFVFTTNGKRTLNLPCPAETCATPRLPAPRTVRLIPAANPVHPGTTLHKPSAPNVLSGGTQCFGRRRPQARHRRSAAWPCGRASRPPKSPATTERWPKKRSRGRRDKNDSHSCPGMTRTRRRGGSTRPRAPTSTRRGIGAYDGDSSARTAAVFRSVRQTLGLTWTHKGGR